jgi:type VI secretion system protein ImpH
MVEEPFLFDFFQLVHLLETRLASPVGVGRQGPLRQETVRLRPDTSLTFSPADVRHLEEPGRWEEWEGREGEAPDSWRVTVNFMGLYGVASPSPVYFSELVGFTDVDAGPLTDFLDIFNHRLISLFYRAWSKYRYPWRYEGGARDEVSAHLLSFIGFREPEVRPLARVPAPRLLRYLGLLALPTRPAAGLARLLADALGGVPVAVRQWMLRWVKVPPESLNRLGAANATLGHDLTVGEAVPDRSGKIRVVVGPLSWKQYVEYLPRGERFRHLSNLVRLWVGSRFDFDVELVIRREEVPEMRLDASRPAQLGWTAWASSPRGLAADPSVVFPPAAAAS